MRFRFWKYFGGVGVTGTVAKIPALFMMLAYWCLVVLGILGIAAFIYAII